MIPGAIVGAILGAIGALLGYGVSLILWRDPENRRSWPGAVGAVLALTLLHPVTQYLNRPTPESVLAAVGAREPVYGAIRQNDPALWFRLRSEDTERANPQPRA